VISIRKAVIISFAENYSTMFIGFIGIMLIARLLVPAEIGIYSVASAVTSIAQMMRDTGVGNYLIQECELTRERIQTSLTIAIITSWTVRGLLYLSSSWAADFYNEPGLADLVKSSVSIF